MPSDKKTAQPAQSSPRVLIIDPTTTLAMTTDINALVNEMLPEEWDTMVIIATSGRYAWAYINDDASLEKRAEEVVKAIPKGHLKGFSAILVACFGARPYVEMIQNIVGPSVYVSGLLEASVLTAISVLPIHTPPGNPTKTWGIVTTCTFWEEELNECVETFLALPERSEARQKFVGVFGTGLKPKVFHHGKPTHEQRKLMRKAAHILLACNVGVIVMGCSYIRSLEEVLRIAAVEKYGPERGSQVYIVDGVKAGIMQLEQGIKAQQMFLGEKDDVAEVVDFLEEEEDLMEVDEAAQDEADEVDEDDEESEEKDEDEDDEDESETDIEADDENDEEAD